MLMMVITLTSLLTGCEQIREALLALQQYAEEHPEEQIAKGEPELATLYVDWQNTGNVYNTLGVNGDGLFLVQRELPEWIDGFTFSITCYREPHVEAFHREIDEGDREVGGVSLEIDYNPQNIQYCRFFANPVGERPPVQHDEVGRPIMVPLRVYGNLTYVGERDEEFEGIPGVPTQHHANFFIDLTAEHEFAPELLPPVGQDEN